MTLAESFTRSANRYDLLTSLNPGYHRELREAAADLADGLPAGADTLLWDLGCGSGLSTRALLGAAPQASIVGLDSSAGSLAQARAKTWPAGVRFVEGTAESLGGGALSDEPDGIFAAYLFRNLAPADRDTTLRTLRQRLRPGGRLVVHEYSVSESRAARMRWSAVCRGLVVPLARLVGADPALYRYLWRSVLENDSTVRFRRRLEEAGFTDVRVRTGRGWHRGILHTYLATAPEAAA